MEFLNFYEENPSKVYIYYLNTISCVLRKASVLCFTSGTPAANATPQWKQSGSAGKCIVMALVLFVPWPSSSRPLIHWECGVIIRSFLGDWFSRWQKTRKDSERQDDAPVALHDRLPRNVAVAAVVLNVEWRIFVNGSSLHFFLGSDFHEPRYFSLSSILLRRLTRL